MRLRVLHIGIATATSVVVIGAIALIVSYSLAPQTFVDHLPERIRLAKVVHCEYSSERISPPVSVSISDRPTLSRLANALVFTGTMYSVELDAVCSSAGMIDVRVETETGESLQFYMPSGRSVDFVIDGVPFDRRFSADLATQDFDLIVQQRVLDKLAFENTSTPLK